MRLFAIAAFALLSASFAQASTGNVIVDCGYTPFKDISKIQIQETARAGEYQIVEISEKGFTGAVTEKRSPVFGIDAIKNNTLPELTSWNGYTRTLLRDGVNNYSIQIVDECNGSWSSISCVETF